MGVVIGEQGDPQCKWGRELGWKLDCWRAQIHLSGLFTFVCWKSLSSVHHSLLVNIFGAIRLSSDIWAQLKRFGRRSEAVEGPVVRLVNGYNFIANQSWMGKSDGATRPMGGVVVDSSCPQPLPPPTSSIRHPLLVCTLIVWELSLRRRDKSDRVP